MANIGIGNYGDFIRQAISMERKKAKTQISSDASVTEDGSAGVSFDNTLGEMGSEATVNTSLAKKSALPTDGRTQVFSISTTIRLKATP